MSTVIMGPAAKLDATDRADVRARRAAGETVTQIAAAYGVSRGAIQHAASPRRWALDQAYSIHKIEDRGALCRRCCDLACNGCYAVAELGVVVW